MSLCMGHVQDENGQKMSKSKGNAVDPFEALQTYGADAIRWYFYTNSAPWLPKPFFTARRCWKGSASSWARCGTPMPSLCCMPISDEFDASKHALDKASLGAMDRWVLSKLNSMVKAVDENLAAYAVPEAARALQEFVDDLSNWYVRRSRARFATEGLTQDNINAYMTLYTALVTTAKAAAPFIPFMTESIYQNLVRSVDKTAPESVHLCDFPAVDESMIDPALEQQMDLVLRIVVLARSARNGANIKNRQPLAALYVKADTTLAGGYCAIIEDELNVKQVAFTDDMTQFANYLFKPQLKTLGPKYGKRLGEIRTALAGLDGAAAKRELDSTGALTLALPGGDVKLAPEDLLIETAQTGRYYTMEEGGVAVALDTQLTDALVEEGYVREAISKVQTMRKEAGFHVADRICLYAAGNDKLAGILQANEAELKEGVNANLVVFGSLGGITKEWDLNGEAITLGVEKL